jgi:uncharacterized protein (DUF488 family)
MARIFTIGHSNRKWSDFISILKDNHVDLLVDVRRYPGSRACPQFNKLDANEDRHSDNNNNGWKNKSFRAYADYMATTSFREGINELLSLMQKYPNLAIMCAEAVPWHCHRRLIADYLIMVEGISVFDILDRGKKTASHELTSFAHLTDDKIITYP